MKILLSLALLSSLVSCGKFGAPEEEISNETKEKLASIRNEITPNLHWDDFKKSGDFTLGGGLLCYSGDFSACEQVKKSMDSETGQLFRNEFKNGGRSDFSRDMSLGWLAYLLRTKDVARANKSADYINQTRRLCPQDFNECAVRDTVIHMWNLVAKKIGAKPLWKKSPDPADIVKWLEAQTAKSGYPLHLIGVKVMMLLDLGYDTFGTVNAAKILSNREPENPFFAYLAKRNSTELVFKAYDLVKSKDCYWHDGWLWSRERSEWCGEKVYWGSSGYEFIFLINLLAQ